MVGFLFYVLLIFYLISDILPMFSNKQVCRLTSCLARLLVGTLLNRQTLQVREHLFDNLAVKLISIEPKKKHLSFLGS